MSRIPSTAARLRPKPRVRSLGGSLLLWAVVLVSVVVSGLVFSTPDNAGAQETSCSPGYVLSDNGVTCELAPEDTSVCPPGQELDVVGFCVDIAVDPSALCGPGERLNDAGIGCEPVTVDGLGGCPAGLQPNDLGTECVPIPGGSEDQLSSCDAGYSLGADGVTCVADGPRCERDEILGDDGLCVRSFQCPEGFVMGSDLLQCYSDNCPEGELLSVDGKRCLAPDSNCPDGSPRPVGGSCLVVETVEGSNGTEVIVRCDSADQFCQAQVKECAEARAAGDDGQGSCEDPRTNCDDDDDACAEANDRLVQCATRDRTGEDTGSRLDPCEDLCPRLHRLDASGECTEYLDPRHPCVSFGQIPSGVTTNRELDGYSFLAGTGQCVTRTEFLRRLGNFEAAAGAEADALALLRETTSEYLTVEEQLAQLESNLVAAEREVREFTADAAEADLRRAENEKGLLETRKILERERRLLQVEALEVFVTGGSGQATESALLASEDLIEAGIVLTLSDVLLDDQIDNIERITLLEAQTVQLGRDLDQAATEVQSSLESAVAASDELASLLADTERVREEQLQRRNDEAELVSQLREEKGRFAQELGVFDQASREIADIISESEFLVSEFDNFDGLFAKPVIPAIVVSGYGPRLHPILGYVRNHNGLDFDANFGEPIYATAPGIVQIASTFGGYGETVVLDHGNGLLTLYAHMSVIGAEVGDEIGRGDVIGFIGSTGLSTGPHLHFEVWVDGRNAVDPMLYLTELD